MYLPYVRGKQFELICLREMAPDFLSENHVKISPIIEPVRNSSTLRTTLETLIEHDINFTLIINPQVGTFRNSQKILDILGACVGTKRNFQIGIIFHNGIDHEQIITLLNDYHYLIPSLTLIHNADIDNIEEEIYNYKEFYKVRFNIINLDRTSRRYHRKFDRETLVELNDYFRYQKRNVDYLKVDESDFSEEHLYYKQEGFIGFSDFLSIGEEYSESGFLPFAVAIHLSFAESSSNKIKIKHFVSDSNEDFKDIAGKFAEALEKLIVWCDQEGHDTKAVRIFRDLHANGHFPGLGIIKKLSMMNHIEVVLDLI